MRRREVRVEELIGKRLRNAEGRVIARIEEIDVEPDGEDYVVRRFFAGPEGYLRQIAGFMDQVPVLRLLPFGKIRPRPFPWQWVDLSDPARPRLVPEGRGS